MYSKPESLKQLQTTSSDRIDTNHRVIEEVGPTETNKEPSALDAAFEKA